VLGVIGCEDGVHSETGQEHLAHKVVHDSLKLSNEDWDDKLLRQVIINRSVTYQVFKSVEEKEHRQEQKHKRALDEKEYEADKLREKLS
jgi:hypothetical protein